jgi:fatty acid desaturase
MKHSLLMVLACAVPLLLIFVLPALGVSSNTSLFIFIIVFFVGHLFMITKMSGHGNDDRSGRNEGS